VISLHLGWPDEWAIVRDTFAVSCIAAIVLCLSLQDKRNSNLLNHRTFILLGELSYSIYIVHGVFLYVYMGAVKWRWLERPSGLGEGALCTVVFWCVSWPPGLP
jgi:peptidoglycan/LPS O-acetylase OafA/YrhL